MLFKQHTEQKIQLQEENSMEKTNIFIRNENDIIYNEIYSFRLIIFHMNLWSSITNIN